MARKSFVSGLPEEIITQMHQIIREAEYGDHEYTVYWLKEQGYKTSRSAVARYAKELKNRDGFEGTAGSFKLHSSIRGENNRLDLLYKELGELEFRKQNILNKIREISG